MEREREAKFYTQEHATIYGHGVWHYLITTPIGQFHVVEWEGAGMQIGRKIIEDDNASAERLFKKKCTDLLNGKML